MNIPKVFITLLLTILTSGCLFQNFWKAQCSNKRDGLRPFLWVTDFHFDPLYDGRVNSTYFCRQTPTTRPRQHQQHQQQYQQQDQQQYDDLEISYEPFHDKVQLESEAKFGRFGCDTPIGLLRSTLQKMKSVDAQPEFLLISGDFLAHHLPNETFALKTLHFLTELVSENFPTTVTLPVIGNNDVFPDYHMPFGENDWFGKLYQTWGRWLRLDHQKSSFLKGGYYYVDAYQGDLRVVVLNSLYYCMRRVPPVDDEKQLPDDPNDQFAWLTQMLETVAAQKSNFVGAKKVLIVSHIPASQNAFDSKELWQPKYLERYLAIVNKYRHVIVAQLYAHLHSDEFRVQLEPETSFGESGVFRSRIGVKKGQPVSYGMIGPSVSPCFSNNAGFRQMMIEPGDNSAGGTGGLTIANYKQYYIDIFLSNYQSKEIWNELYDYNRAYEQKGMSSKSLHELILGMEFDSEVFTDYMKRRTSLFIEKRYKYFCEFTRLKRGDYQTCMATLTNDGVYGRGNPN